CLLVFICCSFFFFFFFFFFQAEDGIRDRNVTGVQTCALPIFTIPEWLVAWPIILGGTATAPGPVVVISFSGYADARLRRSIAGRSEERRVGKECRSRWSR